MEKYAVNGLETTTTTELIKQTTRSPLALTLSWHLGRIFQGGLIIHWNRFGRLSGVFDGEKFGNFGGGSSQGVNFSPGNVRMCHSRGMALSWVKYPVFFVGHLFRMYPVNENNWTMWT